MILEHALAAGRVQRIALAVEGLAAFGGGDVGVANEAHGVFPEKPSPRASCRKEIIPGLSWRFPRKRLTCEGRAVDCRQTRV